MTEIAVTGMEDFLLGFNLAGVRHTFKAEENPVETIREVMDLDEVGIVVVDEETMNNLPEHVQEEVNNSVNPVVVKLSEEAGAEQLREKIVRSIGVDLW